MQHGATAVVDDGAEQLVGSVQRPAGRGQRRQRRARPLIGGAEPDLVEPQPLGVGGESLVQPDVVPGRRRHGVTEPLVGQLVRQERLLRGPSVPSRSATLNNDSPWVSIANPPTSRRSRSPYRSNGYGPNSHSKNASCSGHRRYESSAARSRPQHGVPSSTPLDCAVVDQLVVADEQQDQIRRHRLGLLPRSTSSPSLARRRVSSPLATAVDPLGTGDVERPRRLVGRVVVDRQPRARAVRFVDRPEPDRSSRTTRPHVEEALPPDRPE